MTHQIAVINGPNLDRLGKREVAIYGKETLAEIEARLGGKAAVHGATLTFFQSNHEGHLIDKIGALTDAGCDAIIINAGGLTHTSAALRDAIAASPLPFIEVHLSNIYSRESFRAQSLTAPVCRGVISGLGSYGYDYALDYLVAFLKKG